MTRILSRAILTAALGAALPPSFTSAADPAQPASVTRPGPDAREFKPTGELILVGVGGGVGATFDDDRVVGPTVNLTRREGGGWAGDLLGLSVDVAVKGEHLSAPNVDLHVRHEGDVTTIRGIFRGRVVRLSVDDHRVKGRTGACSIDMERAKSGAYEGDVGCFVPRRGLPQTARGFLRVRGVADDPAQRPYPQFAFALLSILPGQGAVP